ncbi:Transcription factor mbp1 (MBF subunit p120) [Malassezia sp. CBS 17886]|nr:Transcription factor mbp1 (MBF subunit p120) [Malassezia sp. CBS 17886]
MVSVPHGQIFKATYSGVPVYECLIKDVAVMRRRSDAWLNATQILKVVGLDKSQRTRVLEKEVQKGVHEKVQGGYGKYQGTWIPMEIAIALAEHYHIRDLLDPIISFVPSDTSPPPAPKHAIAASGRLKKTPSDLGSLRMRASSDEIGSDMLGVDEYARSEGTISPSPSDISSSSRTPSPIAPDAARSDAYGPRYAADARAAATAPSAHTMYTPGGRMPPAYGTYSDPYGMHMTPSMYDEVEPQARYAEIILDYFISETTTIPPLLVNPPADFDPNMSIDEDEHTALHWACAMGRIRVAKLLLSAGADVFRVNSNGQTALMRAAMFSNNYDLRKFPELFELLHRSILNIDRNDRTVFHHVVDLALSRGKPHASRYYLETMIHRLSEYGEQLADILNFQDDEGETALTMAARARSKRLVKLLLEHGADPKIRNKEGKNAEDYIVEDERFRASPSRTNAAAPAADGASAHSSAPHSSEAGQRAAGRAVGLVSTLLHDLADSYDTELAVLEKKLTHAQSLLVQIQGEIADSTRIEGSLREDGRDADAQKQEVAHLQKALEQAYHERTYAERERAWRDTQTRLQRARAEHGLSHAELRAPPGVDGDVAQLLQAPAGSLYAELQQLRAQVSSELEREQALFREHIDTVRDDGTGRTMAMYRRLIAAGCGGIPTNEVDPVVAAVGELAEDGDNTAAAQRLEQARQPPKRAEPAAPSVPPLHDANPEQHGPTPIDVDPPDALDAPPSPHAPDLCVRGARTTRGSTKRVRTADPPTAAASATGPDALKESAHPLPQRARPVGLRKGAHPNFVSSDDGYTLICGLQADETLIIRGVFSVAVLRGSVWVAGSTLFSSSAPFIAYAPEMYPAAAIVAGGRTARAAAGPARSETDATVPPPLHAYATVVCIGTVETGLGHIARVCPLLGTDPCSTQAAFLSSSFSILQDATMSDTLQLPSEWHGVWDALAASVPDPSERFVLLMRGVKNAGKSTFARILLNALLAPVTCGGGPRFVAFLDLDVGQPEFGPPGFVALHVFDAAQMAGIFGPAWCLSRLPVRAHFVGDTSPRDDPARFAEATRSLIEYFAVELQHYRTDALILSHLGIATPSAYAAPCDRIMPLIVNTHGWTRGLGLDLVLRATALLRPTHVLDWGAEGVPADPRAGPGESDAQTPVPFLLHPWADTSLGRAEASVRTRRLNAAESRAASLLAYLHAEVLPAPGTAQVSVWDFTRRLVSRDPWAVHATEGLPGGIAVLPTGADVDASLQLYALNGSLVALVASPEAAPGEGPKVDGNGHTEGAMDSADAQGAHPQDAAWRRTLRHTAAACPTAPAYGLALVRSIDRANALLHILTPLPLSWLGARAKLVSAPLGAVKGALDLPVWGSLDDSTYAAVLQPPLPTAFMDAAAEPRLAGVPRSHVPYLSFPPDLLGGGAGAPDAIGSRPRRVRRNLMRRAQMR